MRLAFMGTPDFAATVLLALHKAGHDIAAVYTQPARPASRGHVTPSAVEKTATELGLPLRTPASLRSAEVQAEFAALSLDVAVVAAYGLLLPPAILAAPRYGCLNVHASLLPRWRGAAPVQRAILAGDTETGVTIMEMERGLDTGPMLATARLPIGRHTAISLTAALADLGAELLLQVLADDHRTATPQPETGITYAHKIAKSEAAIDWQAPAIATERLVRAMQVSPGAWFPCAGQRVKLLAAQVVPGAGTPGCLIAPATIATGSGALLLERVQPAGKKPMPAADWLRGRRLEVGDCLK